MSQITTSVTFIPSAYDSGTFTTNSSYPTSNGLSNTSSTSYARFTMSTTAQYCIYSIGISGIPSNAIINSVTCSVKAAVSNTANTTTRTVQLYAGTTAKGSSYTLPASSSTTTFSLTPGAWTASELQNCKLRFDGQRSGNNSRYIMFYGAALTVNYTYTSYDITSTLSTDKVDSISPAGLTSVSEGDDYTLVINADSADDFRVEDNGTDVTSQIVRHNTQSDTFTTSFTPSSYDSTVSSYYSGYNNTNDSAVDGVYNSNYPSNGVASETSSNRACVFSNTGSSAQSILAYKFDTSSIPQNAVITSITCTAKASAYSATTYFSSRVLQLYCGNTAKGSSANVTANGGTGSAYTFDGGSWTVAELQDINLRYTVTRSTSNTSAAASFSFWGATLTIGYTVAPENPYYWTYTISNVTTAHTIIISDAIILPPDEDPNKTYYPITISSANATTDPGRGTTRVESGTTETITIYPSDPLVTLITDNGVDVSSQLVQHGSTIPTPTVSSAQGASYGFTYSSSTGYYVSNNKGVDKSAALCRVDFDLPVRCLVTFNYINYAEATYDFGVFGNIDTTLSTSYYAAGSGGATITDNSYKLACNTSTYNTSSVQTLTYEIPSGQHYIYIKYSKDDATGENNDTLQWKIASIEELEPNNYYTYTLSNINQQHSLIFIFGNVQYYFINSSTNSDCTLYPNGQMVQLPGDSYRLTIVPNNSGDTVTLTDNNVDVSSQLERKEVTTEKEGVSTTVVNYIYTLNNIQTAHTLYATSVQSGLLNKIKDGNSWVDGILYKKQGGGWVVVSHTNVYIKGNSWTQCTGQTITTKGIVFGGVVNDGGE